VDVGSPWWSGVVRTDEPSLTARGVALARSRFDRPATATGDPAGDVALARSLLADAPDELRRRIAERRADPTTRTFGGFLRVRTGFFDRAVLDAMARGVGQVVILGAGYDGRGLRFRSPGVRFFEVDHPATQADKRARLDRLGLGTAGITFVTADFTRPGTGEALAAAGHREEAATLFLLEGVLRYLPERSVHDLLAAAAHRCAPGGELAVSLAVEPPHEDAGDTRRRRAHERRLADSGEPVLTVPEREVALGWLATAGWTVDQVLDPQSAGHPDARAGWLLVHAHR
jgi:methyltransferase (TIGR00027 family)